MDDIALNYLQQPQIYNITKKHNARYVNEFRVQCIKTVHNYNLRVFV